MATLKLRHLHVSLVMGALAAAPAAAQTPVPSVSVSFGVDTTAADVGDIVRLVHAYLEQPDTTAGARGLWSRIDPLDSRAGDVQRGFAYQGFPATVVGVMSAVPGDSVYVVKVLYGRAADSTGQQIMLLALQRLYALRAPAAPYRWQLSNALPRLTRDWLSRSVGRLTFHYAPGQVPDPERAALTARFVDSVAALFALPPPERLDYYVTASPDEYLRAIGLDFFPLPSGRGTSSGGNSLPGSGIVLAGDPVQGEAYLHEVAHAVLGGRMGGRGLLGEGVPTWLGGSKGRSPRELYHLLVEYQRMRPDVSLEAIVRGTSGQAPEDTDASYATGALFIDAVYRRKGVAGLRALVGSPNDPAGLLSAMRKHLGIGKTDAKGLERWWRSAASAAASGPR